MIKQSYCIFLFLVFGFQAAWAQWEIKGLDRSQNQIIRHAQQALSDTLSLPFRDDFTESATLSSARWTESPNVFIDPSIALNPPSYHVASLDGLKIDGSPYQTNSGDGTADILSSKAINLDGLTNADSVYLSFFWQLAGLGAEPETTDRLIVQFFTTDNGGSWQDVAVYSSSDGLSNRFKQEFIPVQNTTLHAGFRFRFVSFCDLSGRFDVWNIDYVLVDKNRSKRNTRIPDAALTRYTHAPFGEYYAVPLRQLMQPRITSSPLISGYFSQKEGTQSESYSYTSQLWNLGEDTLIQTLANSAAFSAAPLTAVPLNLGVISPQALQDYADVAGKDSVEVLLKTYLEDPEQEYFDNDTLRQIITLKDFYAYDDGTAEYAGGASSRNTQVALKFGQIQGERLSAIDICFVNYEGASSLSTIDLVIWQSENGRPGAEIYRYPAVVSKAPGMNNFTSYPLPAPQYIAADTFFVGYQHLEDGKIYVGLDNNTQFGKRLYSKSNEIWEQNPGTSTPMIRVRFTPTDINGIDEKAEQIAVYPNPSKGQITLSAQINDIRIFDLSGKEMPWKSYHRDHQNHTLVIENTSQGLYILRGTKQHTPVYTKIYIE
ncbi:T9SS type A sorting domain-containing protein [Cytophagales bacterium LB-30]|uniref:T9SS type A sorting domain-containing protein n=1 Tax=Shiella aurantiaca TaxID=3058365 RepID=A0ABT8F435_9BACT|nr:T9SS type A sorting domain-containing protein [Shiella aurantiaca]MDN4165222.1 T9SS type A sorting domain-containing protein [Shiella aurantiaca]